MFTYKNALIAIVLTVLGTGMLSFVAINLTLSSAALPSEIEGNAKDKLLIETSIHARHTASQLGITESVIEALAKFAEQIWVEETIPDVPSYYHDSRVLSAPPDVFFDTRSGYNRTLSLNYSGFKVAPSAFDADYQDTYKNSVSESVNPYHQINSTISAAINRSAKLDILFRQLYASYPEHAWLYMGFELGFHRSFPWHGPYSRSYDPRIRPWYVGAVTGAKDVVLIMDVSGSMSGTRIENTKVAMGQVLGTLGPRDRFTVLTFSGTVSRYSSGLQVASSQNIGGAKSYINERSAAGGTNINAAILDALDILKGERSSDRTPLVIFMTDGEATSGEKNTTAILSNIQDANTEVDARIFVFGLGSLDFYSLLDRIGSQNEGATVYVLESEDLDDAMSFYYRFFSSQIDQTVHWSWPYVDASGFGIIITASKTVVVNGTLIGVVGADLSLGSLVKSLADFQPSKNGYSFVFDSGGTAVIHPSFTSLPVGDWQEEEIRVPIQSLETGEQAFIDLVDQANEGISSVGIADYSGEKRVVAMVPIGETSMRLASVTPLLDFLDPTTIHQMDTIASFALGWLGGTVALGFIVALGLVTKYREDFM